MTSIKISAKGLTEVTGVIKEPVTLTEAKDHLRVTHSAEDDLISRLISAARLHCERHLERGICLRTVRADVPHFYDEFILPYRPIDALKYIKYYNTASPSALTTLFAYDGIPLDQTYSLIKDVVRRSYGQTVPDVYPRADAVQITFDVGYSLNFATSPATHTIPENIIQAVLILVGDLYENRESQITGTIVSENKTVERLLNAERIYY